VKATGTLHSAFSVSYGGCILLHDLHLAESLPVVDAPFAVAGNEARFVPPDAAVRIVNGNFKEFTGNKPTGFGFHDEPWKISFTDTEIKHDGGASLRLEGFTSDPHGHGRLMQSVRVTTQRCYRVRVWVKTEGLHPTSAFRFITLASYRELAPRQFNLPATMNWRKFSSLFNSLKLDKVIFTRGCRRGRPARSGSTI